MKIKECSACQKKIETWWYPPNCYYCEECLRKMAAEKKNNKKQTFGILKPEVKAIYSVKGQPVAVDKNGNVVSHSHYSSDPHGWKYAGKQGKKTYITI